MGNRRLLLLTAVCVIVVTANVACRKQIISGRFPSATELEEIAAAPQPTEVFTVDEARLEQWDLTGPFPESLMPTPFESDAPWWTLLTEEVEAQGITPELSESMHCVAREIGLFRMVNDAWPSDSLDDFIIARCGATVRTVSSNWIAGEVADEVTDEELFERWGESVGEMIDAALEAKPVSVGMWAGRLDGMAAFVIVQGTPKVFIEEMTFVPDDAGLIHIRGEVLQDAVNISGRINHGRYATAQCQANEAVELPFFEFSCPTDRNDDQATVVINAFQEGRFMGSNVFASVVFPGGEPSGHFCFTPYVGGQEVSDPATFTEALLARINAVREQANLPVLEHAQGQSRTATRLAPHYFAAQIAGSDVALRDTIAMGMYAGWEVDGVIVDGTMSSSYQIHTHDVGDWLNDALASPVARQVMMAPRADRIAIGTLVSSDPDALAALVATYDLFEDDAEEAYREQVWQRLADERAAAGTAAPEEVPELDEIVQDAVRSIRKKSADPGDVMAKANKKAVAELNRSSKAWCMTTQDLDAFEFSDELLNNPELPLSVGVSYYQPEDDAWGRYFVLFILPAP